MKRYIAVGLVIAMSVLVGCSNTDNENSSAQKDVILDNQNASYESEFPDTSFAEDFSLETAIITDADVVITQSGSYEFSGDYNSITVNVNKDIDEEPVYLIFNNVNINNEDGTPVNIIEAQDVVIVLEGDNNVSQGEIITTDEEFPSAAIYSKADTVITGGGNLNITTLYNDGINSRDDLVIEGATITVNAVADGILGKDLLAISNSDITITAGKDGLKTSNADEVGKGTLIIQSGNFNITAQNDGISAEQTLQIDNGSFEIITGGGFVEVLNEITRGEGSGDTVSVTSQLEDSMKGIKGLDIVLNGGEFNISSYEDAIHSNNNLTVNGGIYNILSGDDALHADIDLVINDIDLIVENAYEGIEGETVTINGGNMVVNVLDDAINASSETGFVKITNGVISLKARGDGIDSNGDLIVEGGEITIDVDAVYSGGDSELDVSGTYTISGGAITDGNGNEARLSTQGGGGNINQPSRPQQRP